MLPIFPSFWWIQLLPYHAYLNIRILHVFHIFVQKDPMVGSVVSSTTINLMQPARQNPTDQSYHLHNNVSQSKYMYWWMIVYSFVGIKHNQSTIHLFPITLLWFYEYFDISVIFVTFTTTKLWSSQSNKNQSIN